MCFLCIFVSLQKKKNSSLLERKSGDVKAWTFHIHLEHIHKPAHTNVSPAKGQQEPKQWERSLQTAFRSFKTWALYSSKEIRLLNAEKSAFDTRLKKKKQTKFINSPYTGFSLPERGLMTGMNCLHQHCKGASATTNLPMSIPGG